MRILSAIVLLLWAACFGRCLAEQYGALEPSNELEWCENQCCQHQKPDAPVPVPAAPCGMCEFIKTGLVPVQPLLLDRPVFIDLVSLQIDRTVVETARVEQQEAPAMDTGQPQATRLCEWVASTGAPVRGPNPWA